MIVYISMGVTLVLLVPLTIIRTSFHADEMEEASFSDMMESTTFYDELMATGIFLYSCVKVGVSVASISSIFSVRKSFDKSSLWFKLFFGFFSGLGGFVNCNLVVSEILGCTEYVTNTWYFCILKLINVCGLMILSIIVFIHISTSTLESKNMAPVFIDVSLKMVEVMTYFLSNTFRKAVNVVYKQSTTLAPVGSTSITTVEESNDESSESSVKDSEVSDSLTIDTNQIIS